MPTVTEVFIARYGRCPVVGCEEPATAEHHILYSDEHGRDVIKRLCDEHHEWITRRHGHAARRQRFPLSEKQRWYFWYELVEGRMKRPRTTHFDREWASSRQYPEKAPTGTTKPRRTHGQKGTDGGYPVAAGTKGRLLRKKHT